MTEDTPRTVLGGRTVHHAMSEREARVAGMIEHKYRDDYVRPIVQAFEGRTDVDGEDIMYGGRTYRVVAVALRRPRRGT
jgi:hypothetical protein